MNKRLIFLLLAIVLSASGIKAQGTKALVNTSSSPYSRLSSIGMGDMHWTNGFWAERSKVCRDSMVPHLWRTYTSKDICYSFQNFRIAAGLDTGRFRGPSFHDGDFYKTLEAVAALYASTKDPKLDAMMDEAIAVIGKAQKEDGYIYTKSIIEQRKTGQTKMFDDKLSFEAYNFGHLMTAACVHHRATGKASLLNIAKKAADFLIGFYNTATPEQARNAICPSHYMGITELYRETKEEKYIELVKKLIDIRGKTNDGTDDNSDRTPFRDMQRVVGHAVRANYLFAGVADLYAETGDETLLPALNRMWDNVINHKMYVTGGCGALYDGVSVDGTSYKPDTVQKIHQAYGKDYQLPNLSAHNETCANIGNVLWNWRMFQLTGDAKYMDIVELELYNAVLSGISLNGNDFFYTNPLAASNKYPYDLRWEGGRIPYIKLSNCCPPNVIRTIAEVNNYAYSLSQEGMWINLYGGNELSTVVAGGSTIALKQTTNYPWAGRITIVLTKAPADEFGLHFRIPGWSKNAKLLLNGKPVSVKVVAGEYAEIKRQWHNNDKIELELPMQPVLLESNPLVEETRGQVAVKRGPVVYCVESNDLKDANVFDVAIPASIQLSAKQMKIGSANMIALEGSAVSINNDWGNQLYKEVAPLKKNVQIRLIPYYAWANRGHSEMTVWMPVVR